MDSAKNVRWIIPLKKFGIGLTVMTLSLWKESPLQEYNLLLFE